MTFAEQLNKAMTKKKMTSARLVVELEDRGITLTVDAVEGWLKGKYPRARTLLEVRDILGLSLNDTATAE